MANYNESTVAGTKWQRCKTVTIKNEYGRVPRAIFDEEIVTSIDDKVIPIGRASCSIAFSSSEVIELLNPETNTPLGTTCTHAELYVILYSLYMQAAAIRDETEALAAAVQS